MKKIREIEKNKKRIILTGLLLLFCLSAINPIHVQAEEASEKKTVRVGYYPMANYQDSNGDGTYQGFGYDYLMQINKYAKWNYEFVEASYAECYQMLLNGEIDVLSGISKTAAREDMMLFSMTSVSSMQNRLYARADENLYYGDYSKFDGADVAVMKGTLTEDLDNFASVHDFKLNKVEYETTAEMSDALLAGDVELLFAASISDNENTKIVARLTKQPLYYGVNKARPDIQKELEQALEMIIDNNPSFATQMAEKYQVSGANATATFTREEQEYLDSGRTVYVIMNPDWAPISWYDAKEGAYKGIIVDVAERIREYCGLNVSYCTQEEFDEIAAGHPGCINDMLAVLADDNSWAVKNQVVISNHIVDTPVVAVSKRSTHQTVIDEHTEIALPEGYYISDCISRDYPDNKISYYGTVKECMDAINKGEADITFVNQLVATYYLSNLEYSNFFATGHSGTSENLAFAVYQDTNAPLLGILDKAIMGIGARELEQITIENSVVDQSITLKGLYYSNPSAVIFGVMLVVMIASGVVFSIYQSNIRKKKMAEELALEQETIHARTEFFMMISHELRTPLNAIVGYLDFIAEDCRKAGVKLDYLNRAQAAAGQMTLISQDMLDYSAIATGTAILKEELFDLKKIVKSVAGNVELAAVKKGIEFSFSVSDISYEFIMGDKIRLTQIMQNLLSNAVKFTEPGGSVNAQVREVITEEGELELKFTAKDTGRGMSEEFLKIVCALFQQGDKAYSRTHGGLGLGLYLTKYYIDAMKGTMQVSSVEKQGSTFEVTIPLKKAHSELLLERNINFAHIRGIVAGKDEEENKNMKDLLKRLKIKCDVMTEADKLTRRIKSRIGGDYAYALCIIDESMIEEEPQLVEQINELEEAPILFVMTNRTETLQKLKGQQGIRHVLYKPIFQSVLFDAVMDTFGRYEPENKDAEPKDYHGIRALIAEDNQVNADILMKVLEKANIQGVVKENGKLAMEEFEQSPEGTYQIIFMDIQMPVMDGLAAARAIRSIDREEARQIPIVAVSANAFQSDVEKSIEAGMNDHLSKPISGAVIYRAVENYCKMKDET